MEKKIVITGKNGVHEGIIKIDLGYKTKKVTVNNHSTHDDELRTVLLHKISVSVDGEWWLTSSDNLDSEEKVEKQLDKIEKDLIKHLTFIADNIPEKTFKEKLADKGFN